MLTVKKYPKYTVIILNIFISSQETNTGAWIKLSVCFYKKPCEFRDKKTGACYFPERCSQQARLYNIDGKPKFLRIMDLYGMYNPTLF